MSGLFDTLGKKDRIKARSRPLLLKFLHAGGARKGAEGHK